MTALEMQWEHLDLARKYAEDRGLDAVGGPDVGHEILRRWERVLTGLESDPTSLATQLDWVAKYRVIDGYRERGLTHIKFAIGGAPISQMYADEIGADGYGADASSAVDLFLYFMGNGAAPKAKSKIETIEEVKNEREQARAAGRPAGARSKFQVLYWQDMPSQVKAWDDFSEIKVELPQRFTVRIDSLAQSRGLTSADDFLSQWKWSDEQERDGTAEEVAQAVTLELETKFP